MLKNTPDEVKINFIKEALSRQSILFSLLNNYLESYNSGDDESIEKILKNIELTFDHNKLTLTKLGIVKDNENDRIKKLNENIRNLEKEITNNKDINFKLVSSFIRNIKTEFNLYLKNKGLECITYISASENINIEIKNINVVNIKKDNNLKHCTTTEEKEKIKNESIKFNKIGNKNFNVNKNNQLIYNDENENKLYDIINYFFDNNGLIFNKKTKINSIDGDFIIDSICFNLITLDSNINFIEKLKQI